MTLAEARNTRSRTPLNTIGIAFGTAGLAGTWTAAGPTLGAPVAIADALWIVDAVAWAVILVRYVAGAGGPRAILSDLRNPVLGPFAALYPVVGSLLAAHAAEWLPALAAGVVWAMLVVTTVFGAWFVSTLLTVPREVGALHGGYLLPTVAATLLTGQALDVIGYPTLALGYFCVGILFWVLIGSVLLYRYATGPRIPEALLPTLAIFSAPPAVAGNAWWTMTGGEPSVVTVALAATMVALLLPHVFLVRQYLISTFAIGYWALTFTAASSATFGIRLVSAAGWGVTGQIASWVIVLAATVIVGAIAVGSARLAFAGTAR